MAETMNEISEDLKKELEIYKALKPYLARCLTLNHDLNNPLTGIIGYCEFLLEDGDSFSADHVKFLKQILTCAEKMQTIIEDLCHEKIELSENVDLEPLLRAIDKSGDNYIK